MQFIWSLVTVANQSVFYTAIFYFAEEEDPRTAVVTEFQLSKISHDVGTCWHELGPTLRIANSKLCNLDEECKTNWEKAYKLLMMWKEEKGSCARAGRLADHLKDIGRTSIAEKLLGKQAILESCWTLRLLILANEGFFLENETIPYLPLYKASPHFGATKFLFVFLGKSFLFFYSRIFYNDTKKMSWTFSDLSFDPCRSRG